MYSTLSTRVPLSGLSHRQHTRVPGAEKRQTDSPLCALSQGPFPRVTSRAVWPARPVAVSVPRARASGALEPWPTPDGLGASDFHWKLGTEPHEESPEGTVSKSPPSTDHLLTRTQPPAPNSCQAVLEPLAREGPGGGWGGLGRRKTRAASGVCGWGPAPARGWGPQGADAGRAGADVQSRRCAARC